MLSRSRRVLSASSSNCRLEQVHDTFRFGGEGSGKRCLSPISFLGGRRERQKYR